MSADNPFPPEGLVKVEGFEIDIFASPGLEENVRSIGRRCERANQFLVQTLEFKPTFTLLILSTKDWAAHTIHPTYGMPHISISRDCIIVAGEANHMWQATATMLMEHTDSLAELFTVYGQGIDLSPFFDLLVVHELGHVFHWQAGVVFPRSWLKEVFVNVCLHAYIATVEPDKLLILETFPRNLTRLDISDLNYCSLQAFEHNYRSIPALNYVWYQCHFQVAAQNIFEADGIPALQRYWRTFAEPRVELDHSELMALLDENGLSDVRLFAEHF